MSPKRRPTFRDFWPRNGWDPLVHCDPPYENSVFLSLPGFLHKGHRTQANQSQMLERLRGLLSTVKMLGKFVLKKFRTQFKLKILANTFFETSLFDTAYIRNETSYRLNKMLVSIYNVFPTSWPICRDLWPRKGWDPLAHCDPPYQNSAFSVIAGLTTQRPLNPSQPNFATC